MAYFLIEKSLTGQTIEQTSLARQPTSSPSNRPCKPGHTIRAVGTFLTSTFLASTLLTSSTAFAAVDEATVQRLIQQVEVLTARVNQLEQADRELREQNAELSKAASLPPTGNDKLAWAERLQVNGDFRYRYENIDDELNTKDQNRSRIRARIEAQAQVNEDWKVGFGLASGSNDPASTNQTLGGGGTSKGINLDLAYFDWSGIANTHVLGGKFKTPFYRPGGHGLLWDDDYRPEGLAANYANGVFFANGAFLYLESDDRAGKQDAESIWGAQFGLNMALSDTTRLIAGLSYYDIPVAGSKPFYTSNPFGNTLIASGSDLVYQNNYEELELFSELAFSLGALPASLFADWVQNQDAKDNDTGWAVGATLGKAKNPGSWELGYAYQDLQADAVFGLITDSDFADGGTNNSGHLLKAAYALDNNVSLGLSYFINEKGDLETDYDRLQMDLKFKY